MCIDHSAHTYCRVGFVQWLLLERMALGSDTHNTKALLSVLIDYILLNVYRECKIGLLPMA